MLKSIISSQFPPNEQFGALRIPVGTILHNIILSPSTYHSRAITTLPCLFFPTTNPDCKGDITCADPYLHLEYKGVDFNHATGIVRGDIVEEGEFLLNRVATLWNVGINIFTGK